VKGGRGPVLTQRHVAGGEGGPDRQATVANSDQLPAGTSGADFCLSRGGGEGALPCGSIQLKFERFNSIQIFQNFDRSKNDLSVLRKI
jgi:hypothetical protein